jgi:hypothetical protein
MGGQVIITIPVKRLDTFDEFETDMKICVFCDQLTDLIYCAECEDYKGLMTIPEWEQYTGEVWEE